MKNQFVICLAVYILLACMPTTAQVTDTAFKTKYERETILLEGTKDKYSKNNEWQKVGIFGNGLAKEFDSASPESKDELKTFRRQRRRGTLLLIAGGTVFMGAALAAPFIALPVFIGTFGTGVGAYYVGAFDLNKSRKHLNKAVWLRNRDVLAKN